MTTQEASPSPADVQIQIDDAQKLVISISETETRFDGKKEYTVYKIDGRKGFYSWTVYRRYSEFVVLHKELASILEGAQTRPELALPPKKLFGSMKPKTIEERRLALRQYLLACSGESEVARSPSLLKFLGYEPNRTAKVGLEDFEILKVLGRGSFGKVMLARENKTKKLYALKILKKQDIVEGEVLKHTQSEKHILQNVAYPFLVGLVYSFQTDDKLYMVMDYINGGDLFFHLQSDKFDEARSRLYAAEIILALNYLHTKGIVYRDLKPENILLRKDGHICLTDFGLCKEGLSEGDGTTKTFCGSLEYMAPEVLEYNDYDYSVDWWGLGIVLYMMVTGRHPFYHQNQEEMCKRILAADLKFPSSVVVSPASKSILHGLLARDPKKRLGCGPRGIAEIQEHEFFTSANLNWDDVEALRIDPPYKPKIADQTDTSFFDPEFTQEPAVITPPLDNELTAAVQDAFVGFTYAAPTLMTAGTAAGFTS